MPASVLIDAEGGEVRPYNSINSADASGEDSVRAKPGYTSRQWVALITCVLANFGCGTCISLQAPFYPREAAKKGVSSTIFGFVFGAFSFIVFIVAPCFGKYVSTIGPRFMLNAGIFITSTCCMLFGLLDKVSGRNEFIALSFSIRMVEAVGEAAYTTASFTIMAEEFPEHMGSTLSYLRAAFGVGLNLGPTIGSALYELQGFSLPFLVMGGILFFNAIVTSILFCNQTTTSGIYEKSHQSVFKILRVPSVFWFAAVTCSGAMSVGFLAATLEPRLSLFKIGTFNENLIFVIGGTVFALTSIVWGKLCEKLVNPRLLAFVGSVFICINYLFLGPAPFMPFHGAVWMACMALVFHGLGVGGELIPPYVDALRECIQRGFPDNLETYGILSGLWSSTFQLGSFIGPSIGGVLLDPFGFSKASVVILCCQIFTGLVTLGFYLQLRCSSSSCPPSTDEPPKPNESTPLLTENHVSH